MKPIHFFHSSTNSAFLKDWILYRHYSPVQTVHFANMFGKITIVMRAGFSTALHPLAKNNRQTP
jgi:hypothetical protein